MRPRSDITVISLAALSHAATLKNRAAVPQKGFLSQRDATSNTFNVPLLVSHDDYADYQWYTTVQIGTPPQNLTAAIDTGSPDLVIPGKNCTSDCANETVFDFTKSSTFKYGDGTDYEENYSTGLKADPLNNTVTEIGTDNHDTVALGNVVVTAQDIFVAHTVPPPLRELPIEGIFGFAPTNPGPSGGWFWNLADQGIISERIFALALNSAARDGADSQGLLTLGGPDPSRYNGDIKYFGLLDQGIWATQTQSYTVNGNTTKLDYHYSSSVLDTGTAYIQVPSDKTASEIYGNISSEIKPIGDLGVWGAPCDVMSKLTPKLEFELGYGNSTQVLSLPSSSFNLGPLPDQQDICQGVLLGPGRSGFGSEWIIGSPLLKAYYTVWEFDNYRIGVADLK